VPGAQYLPVAPAYAFTAFSAKQQVPDKKHAPSLEGVIRALKAKLLWLIPSEGTLRTPGEAKFAKLSFGCPETELQVPCCTGHKLRNHPLLVCFVNTVSKRAI